VPGADDPHDDGELIASAVAGEEWALTVLYRRHQPALLQFLRGLAGPECEDLAADTWIDAARALRTFEGSERAFRSLLFTIGRRRAVDQLRARTRRRTDPADPDRLPESALSAAWAGAGAAADPLEAVLESDASEEAVRRIRELLPTDQAEVVLLRVVAGLSVAETAQVVGRTPAAVSVLQTRALQRLARRLGRAGERGVSQGPGDRNRRRAGGGGPASPLVTPLFAADDGNLQDHDHPERWDG
jgi:RNA polymerase sigma-70 factor (ECF subfamily)